MWEAFNMWKLGFMKLIAVFMVAVLAPVALVGVCAAVVLPILYVFGVQVSFTESGLYGGVCVVIVTFGPYFVGQKWEEI